MRKWRIRMNDRYLFRGKRLDGKGWVYGDLNMPVDVKPYILPRYLDDDFEIEEHEIIMSTVGQCTGEHVRCGALIYEGDIVSDGDHTYSVIWIDGGWRIMLGNNGVTDRPVYEDSVVLATCALMYFEIIGNVHDSPELLEEEGI